MIDSRTIRPRRLLARRALPLALGLAVPLGCGSSGEEPGGPPGGFGPGRGAPPPGGGTAVPVEVAAVTASEISAFIETNGTLEAEREVDIVARAGGPILDLRAEEGLFVGTGDLLAQVDEAPARAQVEISRVALAQAEMAWERAKASLENQVISQEVYDQTLSAFESARAQLEGNEIQLGYTRVEAPFDGLIIERAVKFGENVTAGQRLFRISDFDPLLCQIGIPERDLTRLSVGQPAIVEVEAFPGERFRGRVLRVSPVVEAATGTIRVTLEVEREGRLSPGMFATVRLVTDVRPNALTMPKRALSLESLADSVFVVEDGIAYRRTVTLGYEEDDRVEVTEGLEADDRVIVVGQDGLTDATPVQILAGPGAEEAPAPRRADSAGAAAMSEERREQIRERMRQRGMSDEQIEERLGQPGSAPPGGRRPAGGETPAPPAARPSFESLSPEEQTAIRDRLRAMGMTEAQIEERVRRGWSAGARPGQREPMTPEQLRALRERLEAEGLSEAEIEARLARRRP